MTAEVLDTQAFSLSSIAPPICLCQLVTILTKTLHRVSVEERIAFRAFLWRGGPQLESVQPRRSSHLKKYIFC